ncbi:uncharacterized protein ACMZJ9_020882 [Mantella aurantiaca]
MVSIQAILLIGPKGSSSNERTSRITQNHPGQRDQEKEGFLLLRCPRVDATQAIAKNSSSAPQMGSGSHRKEDDQTSDAAMRPLHVLLLWALHCLARGNVPSVQEEIFTRPGSDLLLSIRRHLTLNYRDTDKCDELFWIYRESSEHGDIGIALHKDCYLYDFKDFPNIKISEDGSLIISNVTPENDGIYSVQIANTTGDLIQRDEYIVHVEGNVPSVQEGIFTRPGSDLLLPIRLLLTLNHTDRDKCDGLFWFYRESSEHGVIGIARHRNCYLSDFEYFPNISLSEDGSLIISNVTPENDGIYIVYISNTTGDIIQIDYYTVHVEVPVSVPVMNVSCLQNGSAEISCRVEAGTKPNINLSVIGGSQEKYSASANSITAIVGSPGPWKVTCSVKNGVSQSEESRAGVTCPEESWWSRWGHFLSHGVVFVLYTGLLICMVRDLIKMKNEENSGERRTRRRYGAEMEMESVYYNEGN